MSDKLYQFKKKLAWKLCSDLLSPPIPSIGSFRPSREDSEEEVKLKKIEYEKRAEEIELERKRREPELLDKLNEVIERVRNSRHEKLADNEEVWFTATGSEIERPKLICEVCKNENHLFFLTDPHTGDTICLGVDNMGCGNVVQDHFVDEGQQYRKFADDTEDRNHHGPDYDPLMPDSENLKTGIVGTDALFKKLYRTHQEVEMNLSTIGNDDRRTRTAYRNRMKRDAFELMRDISANLTIHKSVLARAKEEFARFRDVREHVHNYHAVIAACLVLAYEDVSAVMDVTIQAPTFSKTEVSGYNILDGLKKIVNSTDPAVTTLSNIKIGKWDLDHISEWINAVLGNDSTSAVSCIINHLSKSILSLSNEKNTLQNGNDNDNNNNNVNDNSSPNNVSNNTTPTSIDIPINSIKKRKYPDVIPSFFGSTTISNRKKRYTLPNNNSSNGNNSGSKGMLGTQDQKRNDSHNSTSSSLLTSTTGSGSNISTGIALVPLVNDTTTFGQKFIVLKFDSLLREYEGSISTEQVKILKEALKTRLAYEAALDEIAQLELLQEGRLRAEKSSNKMINRDLIKSTTTLDIKLEKKEDQKQNEVNDSNTIVEKNILSEIVEDNDDIWAEVKRVSQIEAAIASTDESNDYSSRSTNTRGRRGTNSIFKIV